MDSQDRVTQNQNQNQMNPPLCANCCSFFGTLANRNLCSRCYSDFLVKEMSKLAISTPEEEPAFEKSPTALPDDSANSANQKRRCERCNKRTGLTGFRCRCGGTFCGVHRYAEEHSCTFDYKAFGRAILAKANPPGRGEKMRGQGLNKAP
ncbi:hypothetical protein NMG60_11033916 [Bertholletia excelsa]